MNSASNTVSTLLVNGQCEQGWQNKSTMEHD